MVVTLKSNHLICIIFELFYAERMAVCIKLAGFYAESRIVCILSGKKYANKSRQLSLWSFFPRMDMPALAQGAERHGVKAFSEAQSLVTGVQNYACKG